MSEKVTTIEALAAMIQRTMASKEDLERFATKEDLERFATKEDLERFATKEDLETLRSEMATKKDLHALEQKMDDGFHAVNKRIDLLREDISDLPDIREELTDLGVRLDRVEQKVGLTK